MTHCTRVITLTIFMVVANLWVSPICEAAQSVSNEDRRPLVGLLSYSRGVAKFVVNHTELGRVVVQIKNTPALSRWLKRDSFHGLVRMELAEFRFTKNSSVRALSVEPVRARRWPVYGNG